MKGYLQRAIGQAQRPLGAWAAAPRRAMRPTRQSIPPAAIPEAMAAPAPAAVVTEPVRLSAPHLPAPGPVVRVQQAPPQVHVQRIVTPPQLVERTQTLAERRPEPVTREREVGREVIRREEVTRVEQAEPQIVETVAAPAPPRPPEIRTHWREVPVRVVLPSTAPQLPEAARPLMEREVTRVVRERVEHAAAGRLVAVPEKLEVRIDQVTVRVENPPAPPAPAPAAPTESGFGAYVLARTVSR